MSLDDTEQGDGAIVVSTVAFHHCLNTGANHHLIYPIKIF